MPRRDYRIVDVPNWKAAPSKENTFPITLRDARGWDADVTVTRGWLEKNRPMVGGFVSFPGKAAIGSLATYSPVAPEKLATWAESDRPTPSDEAQDSSYRAKTDKKPEETDQNTPELSEAEIQGIADSVAPLMDKAFAEAMKGPNAPTEETRAADFAEHGTVIDQVSFDEAAGTVKIERIDPADFLQEYDNFTGKPYRAPADTNELYDRLKAEAAAGLPGPSMVTAVPAEPSELEQLRASLQQVTTERDRADRLVIEARAERDTAEQALASTRELNASQLRLLDDYKAQIITSAEQVNRLVGELADVRQEFATGQTQYDQLKAALAAEQEAHTQAQVVVQDLSGRRHDLIVERDQLQGELDQAKATIEYQEGQLQTATELAAYRMEMNGALINTGIRLEQECGELKDQVTVHVVTIDVLRADVDSLRAELEQARYRNGALEKETQHLAARISELQGAAAAPIDAQGEPSRYTPDSLEGISELEGRLRDTMADRQRFYDLSELHRKDVVKLTEENAKIRKQLAEITQPEGMAALVEAAVEERNAAQAEGERLTGMLEKQNELVDKLQNDVSKAASINRELAQDNDRLIHEHSQMLENVQTLQMRIEELKLEIDDFRLNSDYGKTDAEEDPATEYDERRSEAVNVLADVPGLALGYEDMAQLETGVLRHLADLANAGELEQLKEIRDALEFHGWKRWTTGEAKEMKAGAADCPCMRCHFTRVKVEAEAEADQRYPLPTSRRAVEAFGKMLAEEVARPSWFAQMQEKAALHPEDGSIRTHRAPFVVYVPAENDTIEQLRGNDNPNRGCPIPQAELGELAQGELGAIDGWVIRRFDPAKHGANVDAIVKEATAYQDRLSYDRLMEGRAPAPELRDPPPAPTLEQLGRLVTGLLERAYGIDEELLDAHNKIAKLKKRLKKLERAE